MKGKYILLLAASFLLITSCNRNEGSLFGNLTSQERIQQYMSGVEKTLTAPANGWEMLYFPTETSGGHALICKFEVNQVVKFAAKNSIATGNKYKEAVSTWSIAPDQGPVLTFDTYNDILHVYSDPAIYSAGEGYEGDYEFLLLTWTDDQIIMKGKKRGTYIVMNKLPDTQDWKAYFDAVDAQHTLIFEGNSGTDMNFVTPDTTRLMTYNDRSFIESIGEDMAKVFSFVVIPTGISFYKNCGLKADGKEVFNFVLSADQTKLQCTETGMQAWFEAADTPKEFFIKRMENGTKWRLSTDNMGSATQNAYNTIKNNVAKTGATLGTIDFYIVNDVYQILVAYKANKKSYTGTITLNAAEQDQTLNITLDSADDNAQALIKRAGLNNLNTGVAYFIDLLQGVYNFEPFSGSTLNLQKIKLTSTTDTDKSFVVEAK